MTVLRRPLRLLAVPGLALAVTLPAAGTAQAAPAPAGTAPAPAGAATLRPDAAAAGWLARQLVDGDHFETVFDGTAYPDQGLTADAVLAFAAAHGSDTAAARATAWLARPENTAGYLGDGTTEAYAGATAKLLLTAEVRGENPAAFGGVDLPARLRSLQTAAGRFSDRSQWGDYSNSFGQSLAVIALTRTPAGAPAAAVDFLAGSQCADGGFPASFGQAACTADPDATALAVQALAATGRAAKAAAGLDWLSKHQNADGGFAAAGAATSNANSTGLATQTLLSTGRPVAGLKGWSALVKLQQGCSAAPAVRGAVAYDATGFDPGNAARATAQAVLGLSATPLVALSAHGARRAAPVLACPAAH
ncbi:prenyltransferase/squalene oxidase-like repeat protein [Kitasatospora sp. SolWspMP-SS2h]|uniref:prenyltransferase/squalene oxidase repeat-containing protein n=1 Tax=Kitasatospora sp. SolWspMP-SS2h TaxID=1305729 RepID=UPI000DB99D10|nr:prenyltransferase/squalene oxidase repeat-containing protein [Kitasatospora sp. SolWspMP-SS2h]RAJ45367.1 prenyltransferase/squalene oxidase-like repeat protein [Kitasatospora sp. SolWspMP-SS2h]